PLGVRAGEELIRRHRLWEHYLVDVAGLAVDHVHDTAEHLEHLTPSPSRGPDSDPHGRAIPAAPAAREPPSRTSNNAPHSG
ncbi:MAG: iron dependent repressor, metal binding and dimerization domain protein, partial [Planctomycetota bacterium]